MTLTRRAFALTGAAAWVTGAIARGAAAQDLTVEAVLLDPDAPVLGNPNGDVTIAEFFDYQCPYCKRNHPALMNVAKSDGNVRVVLRTGRSSARPRWRPAN